MRVYALVSQKGGAGKSTLACHLAALAAADGPVFMVDRDPQESCGKWWERRRSIEPAPQWPDLLDLDGQTLPQAVAALKARPGALFLDTRPAVQEPEIEAARLADMIVVPVRATVKDVEAILATLDMVKRVGRPAVIVVNAARNEGRAKDAKAALSEFGIPVCPHFVTDRTVFHDADVDGRTVMEMRGAAAEAAAGELRRVWGWIEEQRA